jgi:hypothetical protein
MFVLIKSKNEMIGKIKAMYSWYTLHYKCKFKIFNYIYLIFIRSNLTFTDANIYIYKTYKRKLIFWVFHLQLPLNRYILLESEN